MSALRLARRMAGKAIRSVTFLRRHWDISTDYRLIQEVELGKLGNGWASRLTARRQERAYMALLSQMRAGQPREDLVIAARAIDSLGLASASLLEVGWELA